MAKFTLESILQYRSDMRYCKALMRDGSKTFHAASWLLPGYYRSAATALYAFCRVADDEIDDNGAHRDSLLLLQGRLGKIYTGQPIDHPVDRRLADVVERFDIPMALPMALLEGFEWDVIGRRYDSLSDVYGYAARVAGTVGAMMSILMDSREPKMLARACDLGVAMQLTNIARDVGEDARAGRIYLPLQWLEAGGLDVEAWLAQPDFNPVVAEATQRLLLAADRLYLRAESGISCLPVSCRPGMYAARSIYREIGVNLERRGLDSVNERSVVPLSRKVGLLAGACVSSFQFKPAEVSPPLEETRFLVDAACGA